MKNQGEKTIKLLDGTKICMKIENNKKDKWLVVVHGIGEHYRRHLFLSDILKDKYNIIYFDLRGHGKSSGQRCNVDDFGQFIDDLFEILDYLKEDLAIEKYSLYGHSMGGLIVASFLSYPKVDSYYPEKVYLSSPAVGIGGAIGKVVKQLPYKLTNFFQLYAPGIKLSGLVDVKDFSHNQEVGKAYSIDPLNSTFAHLNILFGLVHYSNVTFSKPLRFKCPVTVSIGSEDKIADPGECIDYFTRVEKGAKLKVFEGAFHEIHNEIRKYQKPYFEFIQDSL